MSVLERQIEEKVVSWAKRKNFLTPKVRFAEAGYPDRLFLSPHGHTIFIEFKRPGELPRTLQSYRIQEIRKRGIPAFVCDSYIEAVNILKAALEPPSLPGERDPANVESSGSSSISRPRFGKDRDSPSQLENTDNSETNTKVFDHSAPPGHAENVAGRNTEVGGVQGTDLRQDTRRDEGRGSDDSCHDPPNKS